MGIIYNIILVVFAIFYMPLLFFKKRKRKGIALRLGLYPKELIERLSQRRNIWVHAVSVGEITAISPLLTMLRNSHSDMRLVITTVTETGNAVANKIAGPDDIILFLPFDLTFVVRKALSYIKPSILIITETELWPSLINTAFKNSIPVIIVNGRISDNSFKRYSLARPIFRPILKKVALFLMQTQTDKDRIIFLGADADKVMVAGNMKFDNTTAKGLTDQDKNRLYLSLGLTENSRLLVAGSTHPGEEEIIISAYKNLKKAFNDLRLLIAPRHIERIPELERLVTRYRFSGLRVSKLIASISQPRSDTVFLLDTIGQLKDLYSIADIVFMGGSLIKKGGQNMIEPAFFSKPILVGPHTFNFRDIVSLFMKEKAIWVVKDETSFEKAVSSILKDPSLGKALGKRARLIAESNKGTTAVAVKAIDEILTTRCV